MSDEHLSKPTKREMSRFTQWAIVLAGIVLGQAVLYGPSLIGQKILLPLDILASPNVYLPQTPEVTRIQPHNAILSDLIFLFEPERRFAVSELHAGRLPMWAPYHFAGAPFIWPKFSPFLAPQCLSASPMILAWGQLFAAIVAGTGICLFCRRVLVVGFWSATFAAWCYPLTAFFVLSQGFTLVLSLYWLPWILLAVNATVRRRHALAPVGLSVVTGFILTSGQLDVAAQVLLVSGCFAGWCWLDEYRGRWLTGTARRAVMLLAFGWLLGFFLATPYTLPVLDYAQNGARSSRRGAGNEERPPVGLAALPQVVVPTMYGSSERGSLPIFPENQPNLQESSAATYTGLVATLFAAPLAFCSRRHRSINLFLVVIGFFGLCWCLNVPGVVQLLRLPILNMMSHNRLVFATSFAILALAAIGLEVLVRREVQWRWWCWVPLVLLVGLGGWRGYRAIELPEPIKSELGTGITQGKRTKWVYDAEGVQQVKAWFSRSAAVAAGFCGAGVAGWLILWRRKSPPWLVPSLGIILTGDLLLFGYGRYSQCDPALYYPRIPVLEQLAKSPPGRIVGYSCLPALLPSTHGLNDIRGYDPIVPERLLEVTKIASDPRSTVFSYGLMQWLTPMAMPTPEGGIRLPPVFDMLNVRYVIFRGASAPGDHPLLQGGDYWVLENRSALPRAFVPQRVEVVAADKLRMEKLAAPDFDPRAVAFVESGVGLLSVCRGAAEILEEIPTRVKLAIKMETPGLVVLADVWDGGWKAFLNGRNVPVLRVNHALRGVIAPAGDATLEFRYEPMSFTWGVRLGGFSVLGMLAWVWISRKRKVFPA